MNGDFIPRRCPKARPKAGQKRRDGRVRHQPHQWWAGTYYPVGDLGYEAWCPGWSGS